MPISFFAPADIVGVDKAIHDDFAQGIDGDLRLIEEVDVVDRFDDDARFADFKFLSFAWRRKNNGKGRAKAGCPFLRTIDSPNGISPYPPKNFTLNA